MYPSPGAGPAAAAAAALAQALAGRGITGVYNTADARVGLVSVTVSLTVWTNGRRIWCTCAGQQYAWPASDIEAAATTLAALARP